MPRRFMVVRKGRRFESGRGLWQIATIRGALGGRGEKRSVLPGRVWKLFWKPVHGQVLARHPLISAARCAFPSPPRRPTEGLSEDGKILIECLSSNGRSCDGLDACRQIGRTATTAAELPAQPIAVTSAAWCAGTSRMRTLPYLHSSSLAGNG